MAMLRDLTNSETIAERVELAESAFAKARGLMFRTRFDHALIFDVGRESRLGASIHMLFVFFPIDVVYLDKDKRVVDIRENVRPWTFNVTPKKAARWFVELPAGKVIQKGIEPGHVLSW